MLELLESTAFGAALVFGFRHGFDWDHIAALTDLTGSQQSARRSMLLATLYALGHAVMVAVLGVVAILFAEQVPESIDLVMERFVGMTLIGLGLYIGWTLVHHHGRLPLRSRWMLLLTALQRLVRSRRRAEERVVIEHSHPHAHDQPLHDHGHLELDGLTHHHSAPSADLAVLHSHPHRHVGAMPSDPFIAYGNWSSFGIGLLHGVGAETPTQVLIFAAASNASGAPSSIGLLVCFIVGVLGSNTLVATASTYGRRGLSRQRVIVTAFSMLSAVFSLVVGTLLLIGRAATLPVIFGG
jgi:hypothetical protein